MLGIRLTLYNLNSHVLTLWKHYAKTTTSNTKSFIYLNKLTKTPGLEVLFSFVLKKHMNHLQVHDNHEKISRFQSQGNPLHNKVCFFVWFFFELYSNYTSRIGKNQYQISQERAKIQDIFKGLEKRLFLFICYTYITETCTGSLNFPKCAQKNFKPKGFINSGILYLH